MSLHVNLNYVRSYLRNANVDSFRQIASNNKLEVLFWSITLILSFSTVGHLNYLTVSRYFENPTVITIDRNYYNWQHNFPAATICPISKINREMVDELIKYSTVANKTLFKNFLFSLASATYDNLEKIPYLDEIESEQYLTMLMEMQYAFEPRFRNSAGFNLINLNIIQVVTEMGICYTVNSNLGIYNNLEYWEGDLWNLIEQKETMRVNFIDGESFVKIFNVTSGFKVYFHGPNEVADIVSKGISSPKNHLLQITLGLLSITSSEKIKKLAINQRKCRYFNEGNLQYTPVYSYVLCRIECRIKLAKRLCGCIPHFYRRLDGDKVCNVNGLHCLSKYKDRIILVKGECNCPANCNEDNYFLDNTIKKPSIDNTSEFQWGIKNYPKMRLKRDIIFGFDNLLVNIGGMIGLFLGCSILSFVEFIYYFTLRYYWYTRS